MADATGSASGSTRLAVKGYQCEEPDCSKTFATASHKRRHMRTHTGSTPHKCKYCEKKFARSDVRNRHQILSHPEESNASNGATESQTKGRPASATASRLSVDTLQNEAGSDHGRSQSSPLRESSKFEDDHEDAGRVDPMQVGSVNHATGSGTQQPLNGSSAWQEHTACTQQHSSLHTRADDFEVPSIFMQNGPGQHRMHEVPEEQAVPQGGPSNDPGPLRSLQASYTGYQELVQQFGPPQHHVPTGISLTSNDAGMFSNVDLILQAASERLTDPGSGGAVLNAQPSPNNFQFTLESPLDGFLTEEVLHDVFGWGVGAEDWQTQNPLMCDMLDFGNFEMNLALNMAGNGLNEAGDIDPMTGLPHSNSQQLMPPADQRPGGQSYSSRSYVTGSAQRGPRNSSPGPARPEDETAWPHVFRPTNTAQLRRLALSHAISAPRTGPFGQGNYSYIEAERVGALIHLAHIAHETPYGSGIDVDNFPDASILSACIALYFRHFHPVMPILRENAFIKPNPIGVQSHPGHRSQDDPQHALLILTVSAIGATYGPEDWKPLSSYLHELGRRMGKYLLDSDPRSMFSIPYIQSRLLQALAGYANGSRELYLEAEISRGLLVTAARRLHLLRQTQGRPVRFSPREASTVPSRADPIGGDHPMRASVLANNNQALAESLQRDQEKQWKRWLDEEERCRLGWGIYLFDAQLGCLLGIPCQFAISEVVKRLPCEEEIWEAPTASNWTTLIARSPTSALLSGESDFSAILGIALKSGDLRGRLSDFGSNVISYSLYRLSEDSNKIDRLFGLEDATSPDFDDTLSVRHINKPFNVLAALAESSQAKAVTRSPFLVSNIALYHHAHLRFIHPDFLDMVRLAAGKHQTLASRQEARKWLEQWLSSSEVLARRAFAHAAQLSTLLGKWTFDAPWEPIWLLDCALTMWAILRFLPEAISPAGHERLSKNIIKWDDSPDYWVKEGGPIRFQGIGYMLNPENILTDFVGRLEASPWGLGMLYTPVVARLLRELQPGSSVDS